MLRNFYTKICLYFFKKKRLNDSLEFIEGLEKYLSYEDFDFNDINICKKQDCFILKHYHFFYRHKLFSIVIEEKNLQQLIHLWNSFLLELDFETFDLMRKVECGFDYSSVKNQASLLEELNGHRKDLKTAFGLIERREIRKQEEEFSRKVLEKNIFRK